MGFFLAMDFVWQIFIILEINENKSTESQR